MTEQQQPPQQEKEEDFDSFDNQQGDADDDDFGSFDSQQDDDDDDFGSFDDHEEEVALDNDTKPIFETIDDALQLWKHLFSQIYHYEPQDSFTGHAPKSIKQYVLEEASESLHTRITWESVTRYADNDTGIPKVRWRFSESERLHLSALSCQRSAEPVAEVALPTMLDTSSPQPESSTATAEDSVTAAVITNTDNNNNNKIPELSDNHSADNTNKSPTPAPEKRSSVFGFSSLSRFLPHLSKSHLPKSPTSPVSPSTASTAASEGAGIPISSPLAPSRSLPRQHQSPPSPHGKRNDIPTAINHLNIATMPPANNAASTVKRSNTVAFISSRTSRPSNIFVESRAKPNRSSTTNIHANTSLSSQPSMDLFDLTDTDTTLVKSPTHIQFDFKPLVPTPTLSPTPASSSSSVRRNTLPSSMPSYNSNIKSTTANTSKLESIKDDDFGDFAGEEDLGDDDFGDFNQEEPTFSTSPPKMQTPPPLTHSDEDLFGINSNTPSKSKEDDPYDAASYHQPRTEAAKPMDLFDLTAEVAPSSSKSDRLMSSGNNNSVATPTFDLLTPTSNQNKQIDASANVDHPSNGLDDFLANGTNNSSGGGTNNKQKEASTVVNDNDDEDWGDWAF